MMRLHLVHLPHAHVSRDVTVCAFTTIIRRELVHGVLAFSGDDKYGKLDASCCRPRRSTSACSLRHSGGHGGIGSLLAASELARPHPAVHAAPPPADSLLVSQVLDALG